LDDGGENETQIQEAANRKETDESTEEKKDVTSSLAVMMHILRSFVGTGILALPYAFSNFGLISGLVGTFIVWCFMTHGLYLIVTVASEIEKKCKKKDLSYGKVVEEAFLIEPKCLQKVAKCSCVVMNVIIISLELGTCCVYVVFVADNFKVVINKEFHLNWSNKAFMVMLAPVFMLLCLIRKISGLAWVSLFGNVVFVVGFIIIMQYITHDAIPVDELPWMVSA
jgi:proton-coupled amino acid transporter